MSRTKSLIPERLNNGKVYWGGLRYLMRIFIFTKILYRDCSIYKWDLLLRECAIFIIFGHLPLLKFFHNVGCNWVLDQCHCLNFLRFCLGKYSTFICQMFPIRTKISIFMNQQNGSWPFYKNASNLRGIKDQNGNIILYI